MTNSDALFNPLLTVDISHFELRPLYLGVFFGAFGIDTRTKFHTISRTFVVARDLLAPLMVKAAIDILPHLQDLVRRDPRTRIIFAGRDSFGLGYVMSAIDPQFSTAYCRSLYLTRTIVDAALADLEDQGHTFPAIEAFRKRGTAPTSAAWRQLHDYLQASDLRLETAPGPVVIVDTGYKGSIQEMLAAIYPHVDFIGHYIFYSAAPEDPHPGSKLGHLFDAGDGPARGGRALRDDLPHEPSLTFAHHEAIVAVEELLQGSQLSPTMMDPTGRPRLHRSRRASEPYEGINPLLIADEFTDLFLREGVLAFNVFAISRVARRIAGQIDTTTDDWYSSATASPWYRYLSHQVIHLREQLRTWIARDPHGQIDPVLQRMLDSFVHRSDRHDVRALDDRTRALPVARQAQIWTAFAACPTTYAKSQFTPDDAGREPVPIPPVLEYRDRAVTALRAAALRLTETQAHTVAATLTDDLDAIALAGGTLATTHMHVEVYLDAYRTRMNEILETDLRVVQRVAVRVAQDLAERFGP